MEALYQVFASSFSPDPNTRKRAELDVLKLEKEPGMLPATLQIVASPQADNAVRQAAAIYVKNRIRHAWDAPPPTASSSSSSRVPIPDADREQVLANLIPALIVAPANLRVHVANAIFIVCRNADSERSALIGNKALELLSENDDAHRTAGIMAILEMVRGRRWQERVDMYLEPVVASTFPQLLQLAQAALAHPSESTGRIIYLIVKTYKMSITTHLTKHQQANESIVPWGQFLLGLVDLELDPSLVPEDPEDRAQSVWWKAKKWAYYTLNKLFSRYGNPSQLPQSLDRYKAFSELFINSFAPEIMRVYLKKSEAYIAGLQSSDPVQRSKAWISGRCIALMFQFFSECVKPKQTWAMLKPHVSDLIQRFVFPCVCFSDADEELWNEDEVDFVRSHVESLEESQTVSGAAASFLTASASKRTKAVFAPQLTFITDVLNSYPASRTSREKEGALHMILALADVMLRTADIAPMIEPFFAQHVLPELTSPHRELRFRACELVKTFGNAKHPMEWSSNQNLEVAYKGVLACFTDSELPVRVQAAEAIATLVDHDVVRTAMAPNAAQLMQELLKLSDETDLDVLTTSKEKIVSNFADELLPFAVQLSQQMAQSYVRLVQEMTPDNPDEPGGAEIIYQEGDEDKMFAAIGCLGTLYQLISIADEKPATLAELESIMVPIVLFTLEKECVELYDDAFNLTDLLTFHRKTISPAMWDVFMALHKAFLSSGVDYLAEMLPTVDNIISYGRDVILANPTYLHMVLEMFHTGMTSEALMMPDERKSACQLGDVIVLYLKDGLAEHLQGILSVVLPLLVGGSTNPAQRKTRNRGLRIWSSVVVFDALWTHPGPTLQILEASNATTAFFQQALQLVPHLHLVHPKKSFAAGTLALLSAPLEQLPEQVRAGLPALFAALIEVLHTLPEALERRRKAEEVFQNGYETDESDDEDEEAGDISGTSSRRGDRSREVDVDDEQDVHDQDNIYLEFLAAEGAKLRAQAIARENGLAGGEDDEDGFVDEDDDDDEDEDGVFESPLDDVRVYDVFRNVMGTIQQSQPAVLEGLTAPLSPEQRQQLEQVSLLSDDPPPPKQEEGQVTAVPGLPSA